MGGVALLPGLLSRRLCRGVGLATDLRQGKAHPGRERGQAPFPVDEEKPGTHGLFTQQHAAYIFKKCRNNKLMLPRAPRNARRFAVRIRTSMSVSYQHPN